MRSLVLFFFTLLTTAGAAEAQNAYPNDSDKLKLWYRQPARAWEEALPLGNGHTGAMVFGQPANEHFQLNDNTLWSGYPEDGNNADGPCALPAGRDTRFRGDCHSGGRR